MAYGGSSGGGSGGSSGGGGSRSSRGEKRSVFGTKRKSLKSLINNANEKLAKTELGRDLLFKETIKSKTLTDLKNMLANPNAANLYSDEMLDAIAEEIRKRNSQQN